MILDAEIFSDHWGDPKSEAIEQDPVWLLVKYCSMVPFLINGSGAVIEELRGGRNIGACL